MSGNTIVVVGANLAGGRAVESLRRAGHQGRLVLVGEEPHRPYDRPPLSKKFLHRQHEEEKLFFRPLDYYEEQKIELVLGTRAVGLSTTARELALADGRTLAFDQLLVATGAQVRRLSCPGADLPGVHYVRTLEDSRALREELRPGRRAVVVGAGVIGAEVAAACRLEGVEVTLLEAAPVPLARAFGAEIGKLYGEIHREKGVDVRCGVQVSELRGHGRVEEVVTSAGGRFPCDFVVVGIGVAPSVGWLAGSGVKVEHGVLVDDRCRTSVPGVYAAGDVALWWSQGEGRHVHVESVDNAQTQAIAAAHNMVGEDSVYAPVPFFWSDQYDLKLQSVGFVGAYDQVVVRGSLEKRQFAAFHLLEGKLRFLVAVNRMKEVGAAKKLVSTRTPVDAQKLADESVPMSALLPPKG